jgi:hypothetical protein
LRCNIRDRELTTKCTKEHEGRTTIKEITGDILRTRASTCERRYPEIDGDFFEENRTRISRMRGIYADFLGEETERIKSRRH